MTRTVHSTAHNQAQTATLPAWKLNLERDDALKWMRRKLPKARDLEISLYYHPMLGCEFDWHGPRGKLIKINILVDLVSGRAFAASPWTNESFEAPEMQLQADNAHAISAPEPSIELTKAKDTARSVAHVLVTRKRRFVGVGHLAKITRDVHFLKPNWWITGSHRGRDLELTLDGVTGKHYVFSG